MLPVGYVQLFNVSYLGPLDFRLQEEFMQFLKAIQFQYPFGLFP